MRTAKLTSVVALMLGAAVAWWLWPTARGPDPQSHSPQPAPEAPAPGRSREPVPADSLATNRDIDAQDPPTPLPADYRARFHAASDYLEFVQQSLPAARGGDAAAQYYLSRALGCCESLYEWYFIERTRDGGVRHRTLDEAQQITAVRPFFTADEVRDIQAHCQRLRSVDDASFGTSSQWFDAALAQRYPLAQAQSASGLALQVSQRGDPQKVRIAREEARRLGLDSLREADIEAMIQVGDVGAFLAGDDSALASLRRWSWLLAASLRAGDSQEMQEWMRMACRIDTQCQPYETPADVVRRKAGNDLDAVERRAREINEKLESGSLTESDIG